LKKSEGKEIKEWIDGYELAQLKQKMVFLTNFYKFICFL